VTIASYSVLATQPKQRTSDYERDGTTSLFAALDIAIGEVIGKCHRRHRHREFLRFMQVVDSKLPPDAGEIHLVLDNYGTHTPPAVRSLVRSSPAIPVALHSDSGSRINQVERWFAEITAKRIRRGSFTSVPSLEKAIEEYLEYNNQHPKPFVWTADADLILGKSKDFVNVFPTHQRLQTPGFPQRMSNSRH
jgi:hypothetical protein